MSEAQPSEQALLERGRQRLEWVRSRMALLARVRADFTRTKPFAGRKMTALSDEEEIEFGTAENAPWLLADTLREQGAIFEQGSNWRAHVVKDCNLLTGQNPQSSTPLAEVVIAALR